MDSWVSNDFPMERRIKDSTVNKDPSKIVKGFVGYLGLFRLNFLSSFYGIKKPIALAIGLSNSVGLLGLEPRMTGPKPVVLPITP